MDVIKWQVFNSQSPAPQMYVIQATSFIYTSIFRPNGGIAIEDDICLQQKSVKKNYFLPYRPIEVILVKPTTHSINQLMLWLSLSWIRVHIKFKIK